MALLSSHYSSLSGSEGWPAQVQALFLTALLLLGLAQAFLVVSAAYQFVWRQFLRPGKPLKQYGKWAIVTGATDGIGREYCDALAKKGLNIYLVSRTESKLQAAAAEIAAKYGVEAKYYVADLVKAGAAGHDGSCWYGLRSNIADMDVGLLINNAGMSYEHSEYFHSLEPATISDLVSINVTALSKMVHTVLPGMIERKRGCIVNISSGVSSALPACPLLAVYAATKAYVDSFSQALAVEYAAFGIAVQAQSPAFVATKMAKIRRASATVPTAKAWVAAALRHIGYETAACPFPAHAVLMGLVKACPASVASSQWLGFMKTTRSRALKKKQAAAKQE